MKPQGQDEGAAEQGGFEDQKRILAAFERLGVTIFKVDLARRLCEIIMRDGLLTSVYDWYEHLTRIHTVLSETDSLLRRMRNAAIEANGADIEAATEARLGEAGEQRGKHRRRRG